MPLKFKLYRDTRGCDDAAKDLHGALALGIVFLHDFAYAFAAKKLVSPSTGVDQSMLAVETLLRPAVIETTARKYCQTWSLWRIRLH